MSRKLNVLPSGERPITSVAVARARFMDTFVTVDGKHSGQFMPLIKAVGAHLVLPPGDVPYVVPNVPIVGTYATGTKFKVNKASLFTATSKMPGASFAIPAGPPAYGGTCPASALGDGPNVREWLETRMNDPSDSKGAHYELRRLPVVEHGFHGAGDGGLVAGVARSYAGDESFTCRSCYACNGNYSYPSKQINDMTHLAWCEHELDVGGPERLGTALAYAIQHVNMVRAEGFQPFFRIHDAGDFYSERYLEAWVVCASLMTHMKFWAPTRQWVFSKWAKLLVDAEARVRQAGGHLVIRPSVLRIGDSVPRVPGLSAGSGVSSEAVDPCVWVCPVYNLVVPKVRADGSTELAEASSCLEAQCTMCWSQPDVAVSYGAH